MKQFDLDRNYFEQIGLDSGALTMLGVVVHSLKEPGEYRGTVRRGKLPEASFYISADSNSAVAQVTIDLASLIADPDDKSDCCKEEDRNRFVVNPKGFVVFRVSRGSGGYNVHIRRAAEDQQTKVYTSSELEPEDVFSGIIVRPGRYSFTNRLTRAEGEIVVSYPVRGKTAYRPPAPVTVECTREGFQPSRIELQPGQGLNCQIRVPSRIKIELVEPDDGPRTERERFRRGFRSRRLPESKSESAY
jgi:hypothetical protein